MNIGIYLSKQTATEGGGFVYENLLIDELSQRTSSFQYYIFHHRAAQKKTSCPENIHFICIEDHEEEFNRSSKKNSSFYLRVARRFLSKANIPYQAVQENFDTNNTINFLSKKFHIHLLWFLTPHAVPVETPFIVTIWDLQHRRQPFFPEVSGTVWKSRELHYTNVMPRATYVITGVEAGKKEIQLFYNVHEDRIKLLRHPTPQYNVDPSANYAEMIKAMGISSPYLFYPAQFWAHKNHVVILHALALLKSKYNIVIQAVFCGSDKGNLALIRQQAEDLGVSGQVKCIGFVSVPELIALYKYAAMLVYPSFFGPENLPPLEAMALNCPVVVSNVDGAREQYGEAALYFETCDENDLAEKIHQLLQDPSLKNELVQKGAIRAAEWTAAEYITEIEKVFREFSLVSRTWNKI